MRSPKAAALIAVAVLILAGACGGRASTAYIPPNHIGESDVDPADVHTPGAQSVSIPYGPFYIPGVNQPAGGPFALIAPLLGGQSGTGMIWNQPVVNVRRPCDNCYITKITASMETLDGQSANINRGLWLHHMVLLVSGSGKRDATCAAGLQQVAIGRQGAERLFASGNERTPIPVGGLNGGYGYRINAGDQMHLIMDLMNQNEARTPVNVTLHYEYVSGMTPGIKNVKPIWLDANQCGVSEVRASTGQYSIRSGNWTSNVRGAILGGGGHLHDGGTHLTIEKNGQTICDSVALYGTDPDFMPAEGGHGGGDGHAHGSGSISEQTVCFNIGSINVGDRLSITGYYDANQHEQQEHNGQLHNVMAIALVYIGL